MFHGVNPFAAFGDGSERMPNVFLKYPAARTPGPVPAGRPPTGLPGWRWPDQLSSHKDDGRYPQFARHPCGGFTTGQPVVYSLAFKRLVKFTPRFYGSLLALLHRGSFFTLFSLRQFEASPNRSGRLRRSEIVVGVRSHPPAGGGASGGSPAMSLLTEL